MQVRRLPLAELELNIGQIPGLPTNPRAWTKEDIDALAKSLRETPELFEARPIIAVEYRGKYVILGGNMRYIASKANGAVDAPVIVFPADTPIEKMKEIVIKDNGAWGKWDIEALENEWYDLPLGEWGAPDWFQEKEVQDENGDENNLPEELQGVDINPDKLEKIVGDDGVEYQRIIVTYEEGEEAMVDTLFCVKGITQKIIWTLDEILKLREQDGN